MQGTGRIPGSAGRAERDSSARESSRSPVPTLAAAVAAAFPGLRRLASRAAIGGLVPLAMLGLGGLAGCGDEDDRPTGGIDLEPPSITFLAPPDSAVIETPRSIEFRARATDNVGVRVVVFYVDGTQVGDDSESAQGVFLYHWDTEPLASGPHRAVARAFDWANLTAADTITVFVR